jgi:PAS domain S-box-containing protein
VNAPYDRERRPKLSRLVSLRPEHWRSDLLTGVLWIVFLLGALVFFPSVYMALREDLYFVAAGDTLAMIAVIVLLFAKGLAYRTRALGFCVILYLLGVMLLAFVGPVSQIYLLGFSVMTTTLLGLRAGVVTLVVNAVTLLAFGYGGLTSASFSPPGWIGDAASWGVISLNLLLVNAALVLAVGAVLRTLESGLKLAAEQAALVDKAQDAIVVRDLEGRLRFLNPKAEALYGWDRGSALGKDVRTLQFASDPEGYERATAATLRDGTWSGELSQVTRGNDTVLVEGRWTLLRRESGEPYGILAINTDITERKRLEQHLMRAQRVESIGTLAGGIAHDLNNLLTPILASIAFLKEGETDPEKLEDLAILDASARRGADMVRQLLMFARGGDSGTRVVVDVAELASDVLKMVRDTFPKNITTELTCAETLWPVRADPTQIHQLLMNFCVNARDAMPSGGTLTVGIEQVIIDEVYAGMTVESKPGPYVLVRVEDTGTGMSKDLQDRIFEPFFTTKEVGQGTGLGLSTCHMIVRGLGGFIHVYSEVGVGTRFKIYLPAEVQAEVTEPATTARASLPRGAGELILIVDDEESVRQVTSRTLERYGYRALTAANGAEALSLYAEHADAIAVVLTDMSMPVLDGPSTIAALRDLDPQVTIVGSSGLDADGKVTSALGADTSNFIPKPYTAEALLQMLQRVIANRRTRRGP